MPTASELRELDDEELENRLSEYRREMLNLRFQLATGQLDNVVRLSVVRKDVARVLTVLRDREIALAEGRDAGPVVMTRPPRRRPTRAAELEDLDTDDLDTDDLDADDLDTEGAVLDDLDIAGPAAEDTVTEDLGTEDDAVADDEDTEDAVEEPAAPRRRARRAKVVDKAPETDDGDAHQPGGDADEEDQ
jgi:large subunit ribosomal protein L29